MLGSLAAVALAFAVAAPIPVAVDGGTGTADGSFAAVLAGPTVSVTPTCGDGEQDSLTVSGTGAPAGYGVEVQLDGVHVGPPGTVVPQADGSWTTTGTVDGLADGLRSITTAFRYVAGGAVADIPGPSTTYQVPCPELTVDPSSIAWRPGPVTLTLAGTGFNYYSDVGFTVAGTALTETADSGVTGGFSRIVTLPALPTCGTHDVVATEQPGGLPGLVPPPRTATAPLTVTCPALTVTPGTIAASTLPRPLTWTLSGFDPAAPVALRIAGQPAGMVLTDGAGAATTVLPADALPCREMEATAREVGPGAMPEASAPLLVTCETPPPPVKVATLTVVPVVVAVGTPTLATGNGFTPGRTVRLTWLLPDGSAAPGLFTAVVGAGGSFNVICLVLTHSRLGPRELVAAETSGPDPRAASAAVLVVPGSLQPGRHGLVTRR